MRVLILGSLLLISAACTTPEASTPAPTLPEKPTTTTAPSTMPSPATNERGYLVKKLGQDAGWQSDEDDQGVTFAIDKVVVDPKCHEYGDKPESGHTLVLEIRVATGSNRESVSWASSILNPFSFAEVGADGITREADIGSCTDGQSLPSTYGINQKYAGVIEIVVAEANGSLVLQDEMENSGGWEWSY